MKKVSDKKWLIISGVLFSLFLINIVVSKVVLELKIKAFPVVGDVWEFLILLISIMFFIVVILNEELTENK